MGIDIILFFKKLYQQLFNWYRFKIESYGGIFNLTRREKNEENIYGKNHNDWATYCSCPTYSIRSNKRS